MNLEEGTRLVSRTRRAERWIDGEDPELICLVLCTRVLADRGIGLPFKGGLIRRIEARYKSTENRT